MVQRYLSRLLLLLTMTLYGMDNIAKPIPIQHQAFVAQLDLLITEANHDIQRERTKLLRCQQKRHLSHSDNKYLKTLAKQYRLSAFDPSKDDDWTKLLKRVDTIPNSLALAQAINESAWGTSRFAQQGHNLYGTWCYRKGCGIVPLHASNQRYFEVKAYPQIKDSVEDYLLNLNSHSQYKALRETRYQLHQEKRLISGQVLAGHLASYSAMGQQYINAIRSLIAMYQLEALPQTNT